jgi:multidrug efflux pump subunit AcrB
MAGLMLLPTLGVSINMISLFAFIMVLGIVVDDAIVVGENIFRKHEEGLEPLEGAVQGALEVGRPVVFAVLTTVAAFYPLLLGSGVMGKIMRNIPTVVILVLLGSLVECLLILPAHLVGSKYRRKSSIEEKRTARWLQWFIKGPYAWAVDFCVRWRYATCALGIAILLVTVGIWQAGWIKFTLFPKVESNFLKCRLTMPRSPGRSGREAPQRLAVALERYHHQSREARQRARPYGQWATVGRTSGPDHNRALDVTATKLGNLWRQKVGIVPDAEAITYQSVLFSAGNAVEVHMSLDDHDLLVAAAEELKAELKTYPGVFDVSDSFLPGKDEMQLKLKLAARSLGLTLDDLAKQVRHAFYGAEALRLQRDQDEVKVMVRYPESKRKSLGSVEDMYIRAPDGSEGRATPPSSELSVSG